MVCLPFASKLASPLGDPALLLSQVSGRAIVLNPGWINKPRFAALLPAGQFQLGCLDIRTVADLDHELSAQDSFQRAPRLRLHVEPLSGVQGTCLEVSPDSKRAGEPIVAGLTNQDSLPVLLDSDTDDPHSQHGRRRYDEAKERQSQDQSAHGITRLPSRRTKRGLPAVRRAART